MVTRVSIVRASVLAAAAILLRPEPSWPWGCRGHETIAFIAQAQLGDHARQQADDLLRNQPIDPKLFRLCWSKSLSRFADASTWADDVRGKPPFSRTGEWHFLDIPRGAPREDLSEACSADGCVTRAIVEQTKILASKAKPKRKAQALRFLIHFVGDIHQPLHCTTNSDRGGNCVPVTFFGVKPTGTKSGKARPNLHGVWDSGMIERIPASSDPRKYAATMSERYASQMPAWRSAGTDVDDWAWESHELAGSVTYGNLPAPIPLEPPRDMGKSCIVGNDNVALRMQAFHEEIGQDYQDAAQPIVEEQLAKGGTRLALLLNGIWP